MPIASDGAEVYTLDPIVCCPFGYTLAFDYIFHQTEAHPTYLCQPKFYVYLTGDEMWRRLVIPAADEWTAYEYEIVDSDTYVIIDFVLDSCECIPVDDTAYFKIRNIRMLAPSSGRSFGIIIG